MSTPTPRTDAEAGTLIDADEVVPADFARTLERELAVAQNWVEHHSQHADDLIAQNAELRAEAERLKADGAASAFINMSCRASRAEADRNNLRADLDAIKAILNEEKARAELADAKLAAERARMRNVAIAACKEAQIKPMVWYPKGSSIDPNDLGEINEHQVEACVAAIDAAMKERAK
jgi:hypothetical protein